jgi:hypothetical protein
MPSHGTLGSASPVAIDPQNHQLRVSEFKNDLKNMDPVRVIRKHITTGGSAVLEASTYYDIRNEVADHFGLHPSAVVLVGSARTGFSLKPAKRYEAFGASSDLDLAIVSREKFDEFWDLVFEHLQSNRLWAKTKRYQRFLRELFMGWIWPRRLPPGPQFRHAVEWVEFEDRLGRERFRGLRSVGARLYRTWERLEAYQAIHVRACVHALHQEKQ